MRWRRVREDTSLRDGMSGRQGFKRKVYRISVPLVVGTLRGKQRGDEEATNASRKGRGKSERKGERRETARTWTFSRTLEDVLG